MSYRNILSIAAIIAFVFGLGMIFMPIQLFAVYNVEMNAGGIYAGQLLGVAFLSFGVLNWLGRSLRDGQGRRVIVTTNLVANGLGFVISLISMLNDESGVNALGWSTVAIYILLAAGFAYLLFLSEDASMTSAVEGSRS